MTTTAKKGANGLAWGRVLGVLGAIGLLFAVVTAVQYKKGSQIDHVEITISEDELNTRFVNQEDVLDVLTSTMGSVIEGRKIEDVDIEQLESFLEQQPFIASSDVYIDAENTFHVDVTQRVPILRILDGENGSYYLDYEGVKMPAERNARIVHYTARVLAVTGYVGRYTEDYLEQKESVLRQVFVLARYIYKDAFFKAQIEQIHVDEQGELVLVPKLGDHRILFGKPTNYVNKLRRLKIFYKEAMPHEGWRKYKTVSVEFENQVVCKKR